MAKKKKTTTTTTTGNYSIVKFTAFWGIIISGIVGAVNFLISLLVKCKIIKGAGSAVGTALGIMSLIASIALFISVFLAAYAHSKGKTKVWKILFWIFAILALLGILGVNIINIF